MRRSLLAAAVLFGLTGAVQADEVLFKNGDRLSGTINVLEGGKLVITTAVAGKVTVDMKDVRTFASDKPLAVKLNDGTLIHQKVDAGPDGEVAIAQGGALQPQNVPLSSIKTVNFNAEWTGAVTVGGSITRGNSNTDTLNAGFNLMRRTDIDRISADGGWIYGHEDLPGTGKHTTENDLFFEASYDYFFTPKFYGYVDGRLERNLIAGLSLRVSPGAGVGYDWFDRPDFHLHTEGGVSWLYRSFTDGTSKDAVAARLAYHIDKKLNSHVSVFHNFEYLPGLDRLTDYYFDTDAGIRADLTDKMFTEFKISEQYDSEPAPMHGHNDTQFILGVGWNF